MNMSILYLLERTCSRFNDLHPLHAIREKEIVCKDIWNVYESILGRSVMTCCFPLCNGFENLFKILYQSLQSHLNASF
jgi:hypothetical protein